MYSLLLLTPFILWFLLAFVAHLMAVKKGKFIGSSSYAGGMFFAGAFGVVIFCIILIFNLISYSGQRELFNKLQTQSENRLIYEDKMVNMTAQYKEILVKDYPEYEKAIFEKMSPEDASKLTQLLSVYPQLKSSVTMGAYADNIKELNDAIYDTDIEIRKTIQEIRWNYITPWCITSFMPSVPVHIYKYIN